MSEQQDNIIIPTIIDMHRKTLMNTNYRTTLWTGKHMQITVMSIPAGGEIGLELHNDVDQFLRIEFGIASVYIGNTKQEVKLVGKANSNHAIIIPAGTWHNIVNHQNRPLKLYSIYAPPKHKPNTTQKTKLDADLEED